MVALYHLLSTLSYDIYKSAISHISLKESDGNLWVHVRIKLLLNLVIYYVTLGSGLMCWVYVPFGGLVLELL